MRICKFAMRNTRLFSKSVNFQSPISHSLISKSQNMGKLQFNFSTKNQDGEKEEVSKDEKKDEIPETELIEAMKSKIQQILIE